MTTDYFTTLRDSFDRAIGPLAAKRDALAEQMAKARSKMADEKNLVGRHETQIANLNGLCGEALVGTQNDFDKYRNSLQKRIGQRDTSQAIVETLERNVLPRLQDEWQLVHKELSDAVRGFFTSAKAGCESEMARLFAEVVGERDAFLDDGQRLCDLYGLSFSVATGTPTLTHDRLAPRMPGAISARPFDERGEAVKRRAEQADAAKGAPTPAKAPGKIQSLLGAFGGKTGSENHTT